MAKRQRKTEQEYLKARSAFMRSLQRTNKAFGSSMKISDIVNVPTPAQAKKMSAAELRKATKDIKAARTGKNGEKMTFVPTGTGSATRVPTKDYNAAMSNLGKRNKAVRERMGVLDTAVVPAGTVKPVSSRKVQTWHGESKITPMFEIDPMVAFVGGKGFGNVDEISRRFSERGEEFAKAPREWKKSDDTMRKNFTKMMGVHDLYLENLLEGLDEKQFLWAVYEGNLMNLMEVAQYNNTDKMLPAAPGTGDDFENQTNDNLSTAAARMIRDVLEQATKVRFEEQ